MSWEDPTVTELARSIGCAPDKIIRSVKNARRSAQEGHDIWTSFVEQGDPDDVAVFETRWPQ